MKSERHLINADTLLLQIANTPGLVDAYTILNMISNAPVVDAVEVVRCKDCQHFYYSVSSDKDGRCVQFGTYDTDPSVCLDDYCSYGERRT